MELVMLSLRTWYGMERRMICDQKSNTPCHIHLGILAPPFWLLVDYIFIYSLQEPRSQEDEKLQSNHPAHSVTHTHFVQHGFSYFEPTL